MKEFDVTTAEIFHGISEEEVKGMLDCLSAIRRCYKKEEYIYRMGEQITTVGLVVRGSVQIVKEDYWGNRRILSVAGAGELFGESYACLPGEPLMVSVVTAEPAEVLFLDVKRVLTTCSSACAFHSRLVYNLLAVLAGKNLVLTRKIDHMGQKSIREKARSYLSYYAGKMGSQTFEIPFNRQQLADYLAVDRSGLSVELSKMQKEGILSYHKNRFTLY